MENHIKFETLPSVLRVYLEKTNCSGKEKIEKVRIKQKGLFNVNGKRWTKITANQTFDVKNREFVWKAKAGFLHVTDRYVRHKGTLIVRLFNLIKIAKAEGPEVDQGEALRFLTEMIWFPTELTRNYMGWSSVTDFCCRATMLIPSGSVEADFCFGENKLLDKITARRYREHKGGFELCNWEISNFEFKVFNDILIPYRAHVYWQPESGAFCYYKLEITDVRYDKFVY